MSNHYLDYHKMRAVRKHKFKTTPPCEVCGKRARVLHHNDFTRTNHSLNNLIPLCRSCHLKLHIAHGDLPEQFKIKLRYKGKSLYEWADITGLSYGCLYRRLKQNGSLDNRKSGFRTTYGMTFQQMAAKLKCTRQYVFFLYKNKKLENYLQKHRT